MAKIVGLKELRENMDKYVREVGRGTDYVVVRRSKPLFKISPVEDAEWETVIDFTKIRKGGIPAKELLSALKNA